jgi:hypothetical protein
MRTRRTDALIIGPACMLLLLPSFARVRAQTATADATRGILRGTVRDAKSGDAIIEAGVEVVETGQKTRTDIDGNYTLSLAPGTYHLRVFAPLYQGARLENVVVHAGQTARADARLAPEGESAVEVVEVVAQANRAAEATQLLERKQSTAVRDAVGGETIKKSTASDASEVVENLPAVTVRESRYVVVRGLNERYTSALLNGSRLPSTDPDRRAVPLDLFSAEFLDSIAIVKTYTPNLPGDFSGGLADIRLRDFPDRLTFSAGLSVSGNTQTTFSDFATYHGAGTADYFGFGADYRGLPTTIPDRNIQSPPLAQAQAYGRSFDDIWAIEQKSAPPNFGLNLSVGDTIGPLGVTFGAIYSNEYEWRSEIDREFINAGTPGDPNIRTENDFVYAFSDFTTRLGSVLTAAYRPSAAQTVSLRALVNRSTIDEVASGSGTSGNTGNERQATQFQYTEEQLGFGQVAGDHLLSGVGLEWRSALAQTTQDQPDTRIQTREGPPPGAFSSDSCGGCRVFGNLSEWLTDSAVDLSIPFTTPWRRIDAAEGDATLQFGPAYAYRSRDYSLRRFRYRKTEFNTLPLTLPTEVLLAPENIGRFQGFDFLEETSPTDSFEGTHEIAGIYALVDLPLWPGWRSEAGDLSHQFRLIAGARGEYSYLTVTTGDNSGNQVSQIKNNLDPLPGINLVYRPREDMNVRLAYSHAVSRPDFRELSPVLFVKARGLTPTVGNPRLVEADIRSVDARWEWFLSPLEVVSASVFYKQLDQPIEQTVRQFASFVAYSFANADSADVLGFEFEGRTSLARLSSRLRDVALHTNVSYADSSVSIPKGRLDVQTNTNRSLQGQAPFTVNATLEYAAPALGTMRLLYNTAGTSIEATGSNGLPDIEFQRRDQLDAVIVRPVSLFGVPLNAKLSAENLLNDSFTYTQGNEVQQEYRSGVTIGLGLSYSF